MAAQTNMTISMAAPPAAPRIQPPFVIGSKPGSPFSFAVPATGQAPLTFAASGLPAGLAIAASSGTITGTTPAAGSYPVSISVTNAMGTGAATLTLVSGDTLALTPPLGWNSYDSFGASVTEDDVKQQAQALKTLLQPFGFRYVVIDYRWYEPGEPTDANGRYLPATSKYPSATGSNGFKSLADQVHALGLGFGIHIMRGIPRKSVTANTPIADSTYHAADAANTSDPCPWDQHMWGVRGDTAAGQAWYDSIFAQYAAWGIDFVKIDDMLNNDTKVYHQAEVDAIRKAIDKTGRSIVLSLSPGPNDPSWLPQSASHLDGNANMWRIVNDFWDYNGLTDLPGVFTAAGTWQAVAGLTAGHWPDTDMLPLGYLGPRNEWHPSGETRFTHNEQITIMSLWSILPSPLIFGGNVQSLGTDATTGPWTLALLTNEEALAVNQDSLGTHAKRLMQQGTTEVWSRDLSGGRKAVALFNRGTQDATVGVTWTQLGMPPGSAVRDVWQRAALSVTGSGPSMNVPYAGAMLLVITPPGGQPDGGVIDGGRDATSSVADANADARAPDASSATGGTSGGGDEGGIASSTGAGTTGDDGTTVGGSTAGGETTGASSTGQGGRTSGSASSGAAASATTSGASTRGTTAGDSSGTDSGSSPGCSCSIPSRSGSPPWMARGWLAAIAVALLRRRTRLRNGSRPDAS